VPSFGRIIGHLAVPNASLQPDASAWLAGKAEGSIKALSVAGQAAAIVNGSLPSGFEEGHVPPLWVLELIIKVGPAAVHGACGCIPAVSRSSAHHKVDHCSA
jgi:hypothetical protein